MSGTVPQALRSPVLDQWSSKCGPRPTDSAPPNSCPPLLPPKLTESESELCLVAQSCPAVCDPMDCSPPGSSAHGDSPGKYTGVGCHALLQGVFPTQGSNPGLLHCRWIFYYLRHQESLEWVAYPFSRGYSWPRNWTGISCIAGEFFTSWTTKEAQNQRKTRGLCPAIYHLTIRSGTLMHINNGEWHWEHLNSRVLGDG